MVKTCGIQYLRDCDKETAPEGWATFRYKVKWFISEDRNGNVNWGEEIRSFTCASKEDANALLARWNEHGTGVRTYHAAKT